MLTLLANWMSNVELTLGESLEHIDTCFCGTVMLKLIGHERLFARTILSSKFK